MLVRTNPSGFVSLACSTPWSQDASLSVSLQKVVVTLDWNSVPVSTPTTFNPSCSFYFLLNNQSEIWIPLTLVNTLPPASPAFPEYVFNSTVNLSSTTLPAYGTVIGSAVFCTNVPVGVGIFGYTIDTCFGPSLTGC